MAIWGLIPELGVRSVEAHLVDMHGEWRVPSQQRTWDTMGVWVCGPMPKPGKRLSMETHSRYGMIHPTLLDGATSNRGYPASNFVPAYIAPPPEETLMSKGDMRKVAAWIGERLLRYLVGSALAESLPYMKPTHPVEAMAKRFATTF